MAKSKLQKTIEQARRECESAGIRLTPKRINVFSVLLSAKTAISAYQVVDDYNAEYEEKLKAMSVYRILNFLVEAGLVHRLETTNQYIACSHITCDHEHQIPQFLICNNCQQVTEVGLHKTLVDELKLSVSGCGFSVKQSAA